MIASNRLVTNILSNWSGFAVNLAIGLFLAPFIVESLGAVYYGIWIVLNQLTGYMSVLDFGVRSAVTKHVAAHHARENTDALNRVVNTAVTIYSGVAVASLLITVGIVWWLPSLFPIPTASVRTAQAVVAIGGITVAHGFVFAVCYGVLMGIQRYDLFNRLAVVFALVRAVLIIVVLRRGYGLVGLAAVQSLTSILNSTCAYWFVRRELPQLRVRFVGRISGAYAEVVNYSAGTFFVTISQKVIYQLDTLIIGIVIGPVAVTMYSIPATLLDYTRRILIAMTETFVPLTSQLRAQAEHARIRSLMVLGTRASALVGLPICVVLITLGERFISLWMGPEYGVAGRPVLLVLAVTQLFSVTHVTAREVLNGLGRQRLNAFIFGAEAIVNLALSLTLIRPLGIVGVAIGTAIPHLIVVIGVYPILAVRLLGIELKAYLVAVLRPWLAVAPFAVVCSFIDNALPPRSLSEFFLDVAGASLVFAAAVWWIGLERGERARVVELLRRAVVTPV